MKETYGIITKINPPVTEKFETQETTVIPRHPKNMMMIIII
jgi:hypothetical protein